MVYGIQATGDTILTDIARCVDSENRRRNVENRLSRDLQAEGLAQDLQDAVMVDAKRFVDRNALIIVDPTDVCKPHAYKMEHLTLVRDASRSTKDNVVKTRGYHGCMAVACQSGARRMEPLAFRLWSAEAPGFKSENTEVEAVIDSIAAKAQKRGIYVYDRGGDRIGLFEHFVKNGLRFIVRLVGDRNLVWRKRTVLAEKLAGKCRMLHATKVTFLSHGRESIVPIQFGVLEVTLPDRPETALRLVVVKGFGPRPMLLLTNLTGTKSYKSLWQVVEGYVTRWRVEEAIRFIKQAYRLEGLRVLTYERLRNMAALVLCASHFAAAWMGMGERLKILVSHVTDLSQRIHRVPEFFYYAIADGIRRLFTRFGKGWRREKEKPPDPSEDRQMLLSLSFAPG